MENKDNLLGVVRTLYQWRKQILGLSFLAAIGTAGISLLLPNFFKATTVFLAASPDLARPDILYGKSIGGQPYGSGNDIDRILTIAESKELGDYLIDTFNLFQHYRIAPNQPKSYVWAREKLFSRMEIIKTKRDAIQLTFEDVDPQLAARIANAARERINYLSQEVIKGNQRKNLASYESGLIVKEQILQELADSLTKLRAKYKIYNTRQVSTDLSERYIIAKGSYSRFKGRWESMKNNPRIPRDSVAFTEATMKGYQAEVESLQEELNNLAGGEAALMMIETRYYTSNGQLGDEVEKAKMLRTALEADVPTVLVVEEAEVPVLKSRPRRSLLVLAAGAIAFVIGCFGVLLFDAYRENKWGEAINAR
ncbi:LPS biosynthesis protein [Haliscomenobacter hydrossis]|uniref:Lipopolysaccharide biosynthesis protein n=1 Tax=Haliscomenobacter hydrossis (strain ATCC 27775 / DSM 1100 / LMG 10767 / O) TaxID=760192 RepID=F4KPJ1_HALH1|nr:LPS biosynthesis protein [Haliscomenobacter hydrossis]AEE50929.1 lipopolysaccharide biosynthesis protein [Haliscomenobacter hydrossis DSM 1100]